MKNDNVIMILVSRDKSFLRAADAKARGDKGFRLDSFAQNPREKSRSYPPHPNQNHETATEDDVFCLVAESA
ncbi:Uncharacterized protein TCM_004495 [Theobroma cacao]|uniref:Uncharacterized protein n=1 Tax=Theobroma cacao TaxID=3641 RepID=A0A061DR42_THECC|nr:Uncharacterized protein TCM_004495 [Theobroma cacao]